MSKESVRYGTKMTRQHYEFIAMCLRDVRPYSEGARGCWQAECEVFADNLMATNSHFKKAQFLEACGAEVPVRG